MQATHMIVIKGSDAAAREAAREHGVRLVGYRAPLSGQVLAECHVRDETTLAAWLCEDRYGEPFRPGSLLWYRTVREMDRIP